MTTNDIDAIRKLTDAATEGPWEHGGNDGLVWPPRIGDPVSGSTETADADFIAAARTHVPALCDEVEQLRADLAKENDLKERYARTAANLLKQRNDAVSELEQVTAERDAARDMANTTRAALDDLKARHAAMDRALTGLRADHTSTSAKDRVVEAAKAWRGWYTASPVRMQSPSDAEDALIAAVDALPETSGDDKPCCGYGCNDNLTGVTR